MRPERRDGSLLPNFFGSFGLEHDEDDELRSMDLEELEED